MFEPTLYQLQCFDALVKEGSFAAAANRMHRTHPAVYAAIRSLEEQAGVRLFDRSGYRVSLTAAGQAFMAHNDLFLNQYQSLCDYTRQLANGEEPELTVVVGDLCPLSETLGLLRRFFSMCKTTRLNLMFESISGPWESLRRSDADLIFHHQEQASDEFERLPLFDIQLIPVAAPSMFAGPIPIHPRAADMRHYVQCIIRDSGSNPDRFNYYLIQGARQVIVPDQLMKREFILQGLGWGHMPVNLVKEDLANGRLVNLRNQHLPGNTLPHFAMRQRHAAHGPVAQRLWDTLQGMRRPLWSEGGGELASPSTSSSLS